MTQFEIIILTIIYIVCYGYISAMWSKEENINIFVRILLAIVSLVLAIYAPLIFGRTLYEKMEKK